MGALDGRVSLAIGWSANRVGGSNPRTSFNSQLSASSAGVLPGFLNTAIPIAFWLMPDKLATSIFLGEARPATRSYKL